MVPVRVQCLLFGSVCRPPMLDSLLMAVRARVDGLLPIDRTEPVFADIEIPIAIEPAGRFHLCSGPESSAIGAETHYKNRRFPVEQAAKMGDPVTVRRVQINAGAEKSYRIPHSVGFVADQRLTWWCVGDVDGIRELLRYCQHVGKFAGVGKGRVRSWEVSACEPWEGFPILRSGKPLRPLPPDWPGLDDPELAYATMTTIGSAYWDGTKRVLCAVPG